MIARRILDVITDVLMLVALAVAGVGHFLPWFEIREETVVADASAVATDADAEDDAGDTVADDSESDPANNPDADAGDAPDADAGDAPDAEAGDGSDPDAGDAPDADAEGDPDADAGDDPGVDAGDDPDAVAGDDADIEAGEEAPGGGRPALDFQMWYAARSGIALAVTALLVGMSLTLDLGVGTRKFLVFLMFASVLVALAFEGMIWTPFPITETQRQFAATNWRLNEQQYLVAFVSTTIAGGLCVVRMAWTMTVSPRRR